MAFPAQAVVERLQAALAQACRQATPGSGLVSVTVPAVGIWSEGFPAGLGPFTYWAKPGLRLLGFGRAACIETRGRRRFRDMEHALSRLCRNWQHFDPEGTGVEPTVLGGFAFDPHQHPAHAGALPNCELIVPEILVAERRGRVSLTATLNRAQQRPAAACEARVASAGRVLAGLAPGQTGRRAAPGIAPRDASPTDDAWIERAQAACAEMRAGRFSKVVLTRRRSVSAAQPFDPAGVLATLADRYPECINFAHGDGASGTWVGATPETLIALRSGEVASDALAGTVERGKDAVEDRRLAEALFASPKMKAEHGQVVEAIVQALGPLCVVVEAPARPQVMVLRDLQHLWTPVRGWARAGVSLLRLAEALHPTPAVGGAPTGAALDWLAAQGEVRAGWYTGGIGWMDAAGDGEFAVVLRCAWLRGNQAELFAGSGIVADSDPLREFEETEIKFGAMLDALGSVHRLRAVDGGRRR